MSIDVIEIGYNGIGRSWCRTIQKFEACELVGIVDIDADIRAEAETAVGVPTFETVASAQNALGADAAVIATPSFAHAENIRDCLDSGLHVLSEKPFTLDIDEAVELAAQADRTERRLLIRQNYRFHAQMATLRDLSQAGKVGKPEFVQVDGFNLADMGGENYRCRMENPHMWEMAIHQFDLLRFLFSAEVERVFCTLSNPSWSWYKGNASTHAWFEMDTGLKVNYTGTYTTQGPTTSWNNRWRIEGTEGTLIVDGDPDGDSLTFVSGPDAEAETLPVKPLPREDLNGTLDALVQAIDCGTATVCGAKDNLKTVAICSACELSSRDGRFVKVSELLPPG